MLKISVLAFVFYLLMTTLSFGIVNKMIDAKEKILYLILSNISFIPFESKAF